MLDRKDALNIQLDTLKRVHLIGITSGFNSFCANYLIEKGIKVTASEINQESNEAKEWIKRGVLYEGGHNGNYITEDIDLVVYPNGPIPGNPECLKAEELGIPAITIGQLTGLVGMNYKVIAIAGTHGKTTTSALTVWMLNNAFGTPNYIIGDKLFGLDSSWNYNPNSEYLVIEACEYKRQFLDRAPNPYISVITNIDLDHTDYYKDQEDYNSAFVEFLSNTQDSIVIDTRGNNEAVVLREVVMNTDVRVIDISKIEDMYKGVEVPNLFGLHNRQNLYKVCGVAEALNINPDFSNFPGISSRFEYLGNTPNNMSVFLDYAHNPKKIEACLLGARAQFPDKKIVLVWQPHSFERSYSFKKEFANSISSANILYIPNIYSPTRETDQQRSLITEEDFVKYLSACNPNIEVEYTHSFANTASMLLDDRFDDEYICILASAGDLRDISSLLNLKK